MADSDRLLPDAKPELKVDKRVFFFHGFQPSGDIFKKLTPLFGDAFLRGPGFRVFYSARPVDKLPTFQSIWISNFKTYKGFYVAYSCTLPFVDVVAAATRFMGDYGIEGSHILAHSMGCLVSTAACSLAKLTQCKFHLYDGPWYGVNVEKVKEFAALAAGASSTVAALCLPMLGALKAATTIADSITERDDGLDLFIKALGTSAILIGGAAAVGFATTHVPTIAKTSHEAVLLCGRDLLLARFEPFIVAVDGTDFGNQLLKTVRKLLRKLSLSNEVELVYFKDHDDQFFNSRSGTLQKQLRFPQKAKAVRDKPRALNSKFHIIAHMNMFK